MPHVSPSEPVRPAPEVVFSQLNQAAMDVEVELTNTVNQFLQVNNITNVFQQGLDPGAVIEECVREVSAAFAARVQAQVEAEQVRSVAITVVSQ